MLLGLKLISLLLLDDILDLFPLLSVVLILEHEHVSGFNFEIEGIFQLFSLFGGFLLESSEFTLSFFNNRVDVHQTVITEHLLLLLKDLGSSMDKNLLILILTQGLLSSDLTRLYDYLIKFEPNGLSLEDLLFNSGLSKQSIDIDLLFLPDTMSSIHCL